MSFSLELIDNAYLEARRTVILTNNITLLMAPEYKSTTLRPNRSPEIK
jgi:hypothetical protein